MCGYTNHIEIAHIKAVSDFDDNILISEINNPDNLIGLCPNHHWEYDNGLLKI
ncbi:HNH endonuclease [Terrisporobacter sp.]|uniref:HNH endonuclease n=1 Tax=Terrisporobacter sp. TaxID=1965305 RepID=UPI003FCED6B0